MLRVVLNGSNIMKALIKSLLILEFFVVNTEMRLENI